MHPALFANMTGMNGDEALAICIVLVIIGSTIVAVTKLVSGHFLRVQRDDMEATLKMEMLQRGMSSVEIKEVLEARMGGAKNLSLADLGDAGAGLVGRAVEHALDIEAIVREKKAKRVNVPER